MSLFPFIFLGLVLGLSSVNTSLSTSNELKQENLQPPHEDPPCPLNFDYIEKMVKSGSYSLSFIDIVTECRYILQGFRLFRSVYVRQTGNFSFPPSTSNACWRSYQNLVEESLGPFDVRSNCGVETSWISNDCSNITTRSEFESLVPSTQLQRIKRFCNQSLGNTSSDSCDSCREALSGVEKAYFRDSETGNSSSNATDCSGYPYIYASAFANQLGPTDFGTAKCLFSLDLTLVIPGTTKEHKRVPRGMFIGYTIGFLGAVTVVWFLWRWLRNRRNKKTENFSKVAKMSALQGERITLTKFTFEEMKAATRNFSRENLIGKGGYGNVYRGILSNGSEVAVKRFKNCSVSGDSSFAHEVEVIASVKHVNLVALRGYCTATDRLGHRQRLIACDLMRNGSLYDHLFGPKKSTNLSWPVRRKIALGTARGLAYLHDGAQPAIIHRDVKPSNILLDENFEPKLADFGLARFTPDGFLSHLSTRVAGTFGYVAPEYALYGQLTERSDVFSFGVVLLELLSGKQAVLSVENGQSLFLTDWAWSLVREGKAMDVIEEGLAEMASPEVMEKYVLVGVVSAHPVRYARPSMGQIVNILETHDLAAVPVIQDPATSTQSSSNATSSFDSVDQNQNC